MIYFSYCFISTDNKLLNHQWKGAALIFKRIGVEMINGITFLLSNKKICF